MIHIALWLSMVCAARFVLYFCVLILSPKQNIVLLMYRKTIVYVTAPFFLYAPGGGGLFCLLPIDDNTHPNNSSLHEDWHGAAFAVSMSDRRNKRE